MRARGSGCSPSEVAPLICAAQEGHLAVVEALLRRGATVDHANADGWTPLFIVAKKGHLAVLEVLLGRGAGHPAAQTTA
jgi:ankyrin repeat protein